jgi:hypothetical protein
MHYENPYAKSPGFVDLGEFNLNTIDGSQDQYDLYAKSLSGPSTARQTTTICLAWRSTATSGNAGQS